MGLKVFQPRRRVRRWREIGSFSKSWTIWRKCRIRWRRSGLIANNFRMRKVDPDAGEENSSLKERMRYSEGVVRHLCGGHRGEGTERPGRKLMEKKANGLVDWLVIEALFFETSEVNCVYNQTSVREEIPEESEGLQHCGRFYCSSWRDHIRILKRRWRIFRSLSCRRCFRSDMRVCYRKQRNGWNGKIACGGEWKWIVDKCSLRQLTFYRLIGSDWKSRLTEGSRFFS